MPRIELCAAQQLRWRPARRRFPGDPGCTRARSVSDGVSSDGALCSSGLNLLAEVKPARLSIVGGAPASGACERGSRGGAKARSRRRRSRAGASELGRCGWWRGHRSVRRAACALLHQCRIGRPAVTAGGRIPPPIAPTRPSRRRPSRDDSWRQGGDRLSHLPNLNESRILRTKNSTRLSVCEVPFSTTMDEGARRVETRLGVARAGKILRG